MTDDDGTQPFGELVAGSPRCVNGNFVPGAFAPHWDTPEWRKEMQAKYGNGWPLANAA